MDSSSRWNCPAWPSAQMPIEPMVARAWAFGQTSLCSGVQRTVGSPVDEDHLLEKEVNGMRTTSVQRFFEVAKEDAKRAAALTVPIGDVEVRLVAAEVVLRAVAEGRLELLELARRGQLDLQAAADERGRVRHLLRQAGARLRVAEAGGLSTRRHTA